MPLKQIPDYGSECPLGKFKIDMASPGSYTADPIEKCISCNFADTSVKKFDLEKICQCPADMNWDEYDKLKKEYAKQPGKLTKEGFRKFVKDNHGI